MAGTGQGEHTPEQLPQADLEQCLDLAEELFVSCRFQEAARVCDAALTTHCDHKRPPSGTAHLPHATLLAFEDGIIAPLADCDTADLIVAVLLQCGFEVGRSEQWGRCRKYYHDKGPMPFAIAILWLRLRLASGEVDLARRGFRSLGALLGSKLQFMLAVREQHSLAELDRVRANYGEVMNTLIVQVMLPSGDCGEALSLVTNDPYLTPNHKKLLVTACESAFPTEYETGVSCRGSSRHGISNSGNLTPTDDGNAVRHNGECAPENETLQAERTVMKRAFARLSGWTPEAQLRLAVAAGVAGLALYTACRRRDSVWRLVRCAATVAKRTAGDLGTFIVGSS